VFTLAQSVFGPTTMSRIRHRGDGADVHPRKRTRHRRHDLDDDDGRCSNVYGNQDDDEYLPPSLARARNRQRGRRRSCNARRQSRRPTSRADGTDDTPSARVVKDTITDRDAQYALTMCLTTLSCWERMPVFDDDNDNDADNVQDNISSFAHALDRGTALDECTIMYDNMPQPLQRISYDVGAYASTRDSLGCHLDAGQESDLDQGGTGLSILFADPFLALCE